jgi:Zn-dependent protease
MIWQYIRGFTSGELSDLDMAGLLVSLAATAFVVLFCLSAHECAHAWMAKKMGDNTAALHGRLTLNPARHLDLLGTLMLLLVGFGYAKPVPVTPRNFNRFKTKRYKKCAALVAAAGPLTNLLLAVIFCLVYHAMRMAFAITQNELAGLLATFFYAVAYSNVALAVFNLIPIPPLDGSRILDLFLPRKASLFLDQYERYFRIGILLLVFLRNPVGWLAGPLFSGISYLTGLPLRLFG